MKITICTLVASIASVSAFAPSTLQNVGFDTELNARPKLATKNVVAGKKTVASKKVVAGKKIVAGNANAVKNAPAITFPKPNIKFPWDKPEPEPVTAKKGSRVKKSRAKVAAKSPTIADRVFNMDLYAPVADQNDYGARRNKKLTKGKLSQKSYVPAGMSKAQYEKVRAKDVKKKNDFYEYNVKKGGKFKFFYDFYKNRGTDTKDDWRDVTNSHTMAKTKYDWQGDEDKAGSTGR